MIQNQVGDYLVTTDEQGNVVSRELNRPIINTRKEQIYKRLIEIDREGDSPRARREALLGNTTWLASLDAEAIKLRQELLSL